MSRLCIGYNTATVVISRFEWELQESRTVALLGRSCNRIVMNVLLNT